MTETTPDHNPSLVQVAHLKAQERAHGVRAQLELEKQPIDHVDTVEDMLEIAESAQVAKNILAQRYHEIHPAPANLKPEHKARILHHGNFLRELGSITTTELKQIGITDDTELGEEHVEAIARNFQAQDPKKLSSLTRPDWEAHFPERHNDITADDLAQLKQYKDLSLGQRKNILNDIAQAENAEENLQHLVQKLWEEFKSQFPEDMQVLLESLRRSTVKLNKMHENPDLFREFSERREARFNVLMSATATRSLHQTAELLRTRARKLRLSLPDGASHKAVLDGASSLEREADAFDIEAGGFITSEAVKDELARRGRLDDRRALKNGLLPTPEIMDTVEAFLPQLLAGKPVLLVGETGGAKTAAAEEMARQVNEQLGRADTSAYEFVSGYGQMNSYQLMGKDTFSKSENGDVSIEFVDGAITRAMRSGTPLILDEVNAMDPDIIKRLNKILQLRPGDTFQIQEDGGERIEVAKGFCIIVTANEKSTRYKGVNEMSADFKNRFGANVARINYPDLDVLPGQIPTTLLRLAQATLVDQYGNIPSDNMGIDEVKIMSFVKACHKLQRLFCIPSERLESAERSPDPNASSGLAAGQTLLKMETISPRLMTGILEDLKAGGRNGVTLAGILSRYLDGITDINDRKEITRVLRSEGLLA